MRNFGITIKIMAVAIIMSAIFCSCNVSGGSSIDSPLREESRIETAITASKSSGIGSIVIDNIKVKTVSEDDMLIVEYGKVGSYDPVDSHELIGTKANSYTHFYAEISDVEAGSYWIRYTYSDGERRAAVSFSSVEVNGSEATYVSNVSIEPGVFETGCPLVISCEKYFGITIETEGNVRTIDCGQELNISCSANVGSVGIGYSAWYVNGTKVANGKNFTFCKNRPGTYTVVCIAADSVKNTQYTDREEIIIEVR